MTYIIDVDPAAQAVIDVLPSALLATLADVFAVLELDPWSAPAVTPETNPHGAVRAIGLGSSAMVVFLVLDDQRRVDVLRIVWAG